MLLPDWGGCGQDEKRGGTVEYVVLFVGAWLAFAYIPARIAASKGRSFVGFYIAGLFCFFPALIVAMAASRPNIREGDIVRVTHRVDLDEGGSIPIGHAAKVLEVDVIDGEPVVLVTGPAGSSHWISMKAVGGGAAGGRSAGGYRSAVNAAPTATRTDRAAAPTAPARPSPPPATFRMAPVEDTRNSFFGVEEPTRVPAPVAAPQSRVAAWLDDAAPADPFDFANRPHLRFEVARIDARSPARRGNSTALGVAYDLSSWFPIPDDTEAAKAAYVLSVVLLDGSERPTDFAVRGKSTLLVTNQRLVGVCPEGESVRGAFRAETGNVAVWTMALDDIGPATVARSAATEHAIIRSRETSQPWLLLAKPRQVVQGALHPVGLHNVVDLVNATLSRRRAPE